MKKRYGLDTPDLAPDLEWMLTSGQVSSATLLERLLHEYYPKIFQLATLILDDRPAASAAARQVFVEAMLAAHRYTETMSVDGWLYTIAWKVCLKAASQRRSRPETSDSLRSGLQEDTCLWRAVEALAIYPQRALGLHMLLSWPVELISQVTGSPAPHVAEVLQSARRALHASCPHAAASDAELSQELARLFSQRWPAPTPDELDLAALAVEIGKATSARKRRVKPLATFLEVSLLAVLVLAAGIFLILAGRDEKEAPASAVARQSTATPSEAARPTGAQPSGYGYRPTIESPLMPRGYDLIPAPTSTPTPAGVLYSSQDGEDLAHIAYLLGVPLDELRRLNRINADDNAAHGQYLYIPGSLSELTLRMATQVPEPVAALPQKTPVTSEDFTRLMFPDDPTYYTVWFDALLFMKAQIPFTDTQNILRIQLWLSQDQVLLIGGPIDEDPRYVILQDQEMLYVARPGKANPWYQSAEGMPGDTIIDPRLVYGAMSLLRQPVSYENQRYHLIGEEAIAGRPAWKIEVLDTQMVAMEGISIDKKTGFILKYNRDPEYPMNREEQAYYPVESIILSVEYNVDFPQDLFNPRLPWRGGYAWEHSGVPQRSTPAP